MQIAKEEYATHTAFDELLDRDLKPRSAAQPLFEYLNTLDESELAARRQAVDATIMAMGITFTIYSESGNIDRAWPFDPIPRVMGRREWEHIQAGLKQRLKALNLFINDLYNEQRIIKDGIFPADVLAGSANFRPQCVGITPRFGVWAHICGTDLVRGGDGTVYVLEDNLRVPSGVSYMLANRQIMKCIFPEVFRTTNILPVDDYPTQLYQMLASLSPRPGIQPVIAVLTPGIYNSAYFEHSFLARNMGIELVMGQDLFVYDDKVYLKTTRGPKRVDVIYRRIDDDFLDPKVFRSDSMLGVPNLMKAYRAGNVTLANAVGTGVADDKAIYPFVEDMIRFYLTEEPILKNVPTYICARKDDMLYVIDHLQELVVKAVNESGGYGMLMGPASTAEQRREFRAKIQANPRNYIAQPVVTFSMCPTWTDEGLGPRHVDLRPYIVSGTSTWVLPGGLTRTALVKGSLVVNSSQGGGSKDTWVME